MKIDDVELIQRILAGDEAAFASLITKYQKRVHTHAWQKTGDFHIAEDIVQETFLQVYQRLETLEDPTLFPKWIYTIVDRLCIAWYRKKSTTDPIVGRNSHLGNRDRSVFPIYGFGTCENDC